MINLKTYAFQDHNTMCLRTDPKLLAEAKERGFYNGDTPYNDLFAQLFYSGGRLNLKKHMNENLKKNALPYLKSFMMSFEPKHEEKAAIAALLLSELVKL